MPKIKKSVEEQFAEFHKNLGVVEQKLVLDFIDESNRIEGIYRSATHDEIAEFYRFMELSAVTVTDMQKFVGVYQRDAQLRDRFGLDVRVGNHFPPPGNPNMNLMLAQILSQAARNSSSAHRIHLMYETLHPFTDGNGRSGRMLWAWQMQDVRGGFLRKFYYQTLSFSRADALRQFPA